jgi:hypothetical protein
MAAVRAPVDGGGEDCSSRYVRLTNLTQHRIEVESANPAELPLELVGFGGRVLRRDDVGRWKLEPWIAHGLVERECLPGRKGGRRRPDPAHRPGVDLLPHAGVERAFRSVTFVLTLAIAVGLPAVVALGQGPDFLGTVALPGFLQWAVIAVASATPAAFFFLFTRQRLGLLRETFLRQVLFLDPAVRTKREADTKYAMLLNEVYGTGTGYPFGLAMPVVIATLLITAGWMLVTLPQPPGAPMPPTTRQAVLFGFLGAYFFAVNMIFRRYLRADLNPKAYSQVVVRLLTTAILAMVLSVVIVPAGGAGSAALSAVAFLTGIVPETAMAVVRQSVQRYGLTRRIAPGSDEAHVVTVLDGINLYDRARLLEEGIENVENLANANMIELMLRTRIPTPRLVDLYDQAILYLHLATGDERPPKEAWAALRRCGIRTATDLVAAHARLQGRHEYDGLLQVLGVEPPGVPRLGVILRVLEDDEWMVYLQHWRATFSCVRTLRKPEDLDDLCPLVAADRPAAGGPPAAITATVANGAPGGAEPAVAAPRL